jgi:hypothetical protein
MPGSASEAGTVSVPTECQAPYLSDGLARGVPAHGGVACIRFAARRTHRTGRRDLVGAWLRRHSGVSADRSGRQPLKGGDQIMVVLGVDAHKRTHTVVAADANGRQLAFTTVAATSAGHSTRCVGRSSLRFGCGLWGTAGR